MAEAAFFNIGLGEAGSGRVRYGAAMALYRDGTISAEQLEIYRIVSADDWLDPALLLRERGLAVPKMLKPSAEILVLALVDAIDAYFMKLNGPGIAEVRQGIGRFRGMARMARIPTPNATVEAHLPTALIAAAQTEPALAGLIAAAQPHLPWITYDLYDRGQIGESFATGHAFCTIMGEEGIIQADDFDLGLFLIAPHVLYRDHAHAAPELYAPLTGPHSWRFKPNGPLAIKNAHEPVWNEPYRPHLIKAGATAFFCIYCWIRDNDKPAIVLPANDWTELEALRL